MGLHFSVEEFKSRKDKIIKLLKEEKLDALLIFRQESMYWLTGYDTFGYVFFQTLVLDQKGNIILLTRAPDLRQHKIPLILMILEYGLIKIDQTLLKILKLF